MKINAAWHRTHPMPQPATAEQRLTWHLEHARECACRPPSPAMLATLRREVRANRSRARHHDTGRVARRPPGDRP